MYLALMTLSGIFWMIAYALIIRQGLRTRTYGMPVIALCGNITWEFIFSFVIPSDAVYGLQRYINIIWLLMDLGIVYTVVRFGPGQFPGVSRKVLAGFLGLSLVGAYGVIYLMSRDLDDSGMLAAFTDNLVMSCLFIAMLHARKSLAGQSVGTAVSKWVGTAFASLGVGLYENHPGLPLPFLMVLIFVIDAIYVVSVYRVRSREGTIAASIAASQPA